MARSILAFFCLAAVTQACVVDSTAPDVGALIAGQCDNADSDPDVDIRFDRDILPILSRDGENEPGCAECHFPQSNSPAGFEVTGLNLSSYQTLIRGGANSSGNIVVAGDPCASILWQKLGPAPPFGSRMPLSGPPFLSEDDRLLIHDWIAEGARDN